MKLGYPRGMKEEQLDVVVSSMSGKGCICCAPYRVGEKEPVLCVLSHCILYPALNHQVQGQSIVFPNKNGCRL